MTTVTSNSFAVTIVDLGSDAYGLQGEDDSTYCYLYNGDQNWGVPEGMHEGYPGGLPSSVFGEVRTGPGSEAPNYGKQGSYYDVNGWRFGDSPYGSVAGFVVSSPGVTTCTIDITTLATDWARWGNTGVTLRTTGPEVQFYGRDPDVGTSGQLPHLLVTRPDTSVDRVECVFSTSIDWKSPFSVVDPMLVTNPIRINRAEGEAYRGLLGFDNIVGSFTLVRLVITGIHSDGAGDIGAYYTDPPYLVPAWAPAEAAF